MGNGVSAKSSSTRERGSRVMRVVVAGARMKGMNNHSHDEQHGSMSTRSPQLTVQGKTVSTVTNKSGKKSSSGLHGQQTQSKTREKTSAPRNPQTRVPGNTSKKSGKSNSTSTKLVLKNRTIPDTKMAGFKKKKKSETISRSNKTPNLEVSERVSRAIRGEIDLKWPINTKIIRIFMSSTFTDTEEERNALMEKVYPKLKEFCKQKGYEFQVVDMRWGVRDVATDLHETTDLCIREIRACQKISAGPNFITLLSEKYGYCPLAPVMPSDELQMIHANCNSTGKDLLDKWYRLDTNCIPASYILQPVSTWIHGFFTEGDKKVRKQAQDDWSRDCTALKNAIVTAIHKAHSDQATVHKYTRSVCEMELEEGLLKPSVDKSKCHWFQREFTDLDPASGGSALSRYMDTTIGDEITDRMSMLQQLKSSMKQILGINNMLVYKIKWTKKGIDPTNDEHRQYLNTFCRDFQRVLETKITQSISENTSSEIESPIYEEVVQHMMFCQSKLDMFHGRQAVLNSIGDYLREGLGQPLVLHGCSGCGKTSIMAMAAKCARDWIHPEACVVLRFLGTTPKSSTIRRLMKSICEQIKCVYRLTTSIPQGLKDMVELFPSLLASATAKRPLLVLLDSLDQLSPDDGARLLDWLPKHLPGHCKMIVSTLPGAQYRCFPKLKAMFKNDKLFISVPSLPHSDVSDILSMWLQQSGRTLQPAQRDLVMSAFSQCPLPLFLKISFDEACRWHSYTDPGQTRLYGSVRDAINGLLERIEAKHGRILVQHALGYLTAARSGLTETELDDILSSDDEVLDDVFQYWTPPIRRLPPLLWVRIRADLDSYLVDRGSEGARVTYWYHRQFIEAARDRYLADSDTKAKLHSNMADYFIGARPYEVENSLGHLVRSSRVPPQPLMLSRHQYNLRKLHELPYHLIHSGRLLDLKRHVLCNFEWLDAKLRARSIRALLDDFFLARQTCRDSDVMAIEDILQLGQDAIVLDPCQLSSQIASRLYDHKENGFSTEKSQLSESLAGLLRDALQPCVPSLVPSRAFLTPPGGQLTQTLVGHSKGVYGLAVTADGSCVVSGSEDGSVKVWSANDGSILVTIEDMGEGIGAIQCADSDRCAVVSSTKGITVFDISTGEVQASFRTKFFNSSPLFCLAGENSGIIAFFTEESLEIVDVPTGKQKARFTELLPVGESGQNTVLSAGELFILCNSAKLENSLHVIDVDTLTETHSFEVFDQDDEDSFLHLTDITLKGDMQVLVAKKMRIDVYDILSGCKLKSTRGKLDDWISNMSLSPNDDLLVFPKREKVVILDLERDERREVLRHANYVSRVLAASNDVIVTSGGDCVIRIWDLSREDVNHRVGRPETVVSVNPIPDDPYHVITVGRLGMDDHVVTVWNLATSLPVRRVTNVAASYLKVVDSESVVLRVVDRVVVVALKTFRVLHVLRDCKLPDFTYAGTPDLCLVKYKNCHELLTYSLDQKSVCTYSLGTGELSGQMKNPRSGYKIQAFIVDASGHVMASNDEPLDVIFIWDVVKRQMLFKVDRTGYARFVLTLASFTPDGNEFILSIRRDDKNDYIRHPSVWHVHTKKLLHDLRYEGDTDSHSLAVISKTRCITSHKDMRIVIWDHSNGTAQYVLPSTHYGCRVDVLSSGGRYALSHDDKTIVLWDVVDGRQVCTFTAERITAILPVGEGDLIALGCEQPLSLVALRLQARHMNAVMSDTGDITSWGNPKLDIVFEEHEKQNLGVDERACVVEEKDVIYK